MFNTEHPMTSALHVYFTLKFTESYSNLGSVQITAAANNDRPPGYTACVAVEIEVTLSAHLCKYTVL